MRRSAFVWLSYLTVMTTAVAAAAPPKADPARFAPADALLFVGISDLGELKAAWERTAGARAAKDPQLKALYEEAPLSEAKLKEMIRSRIAAALGIEPDQIVNPFGGPLALFIAPPREDGTQSFVRAGFVSGIGDAERMREYYRQAVRRLRDRVSDYERQEFAGERIDIFVRSEEDKEGGQDADDDSHDPNAAPTGNPTDPQAAFNRLLDQLFDATNMPPRLALCLTEERFIAATDEALVKGVLRGWDDAGTLAEDDEYRYLLRKFKPAGQVRLLFGARRVIDAVRRQDPEAFRFLASLGIDNVRSVLAHVRYGEKNYDVRMDVLVHTEGQPSGLVEIFSMPNRPLEPTRFVPDDAAIYLSLNLDLPRLLDQIERLLRRRSPDAADSFARRFGEITTPDGQTINLREQLFAQLGTPLELMYRFLPPYGPDGVRASLRVPVRDPEPIRALLRALVPSTGLVERDLEGATVFDLPFGGISVGVQAGQLVAGSQAAVERAMQQAETVQPLATSPRFKAVARFVPEGAWLVLYSDGERLWKAMIGMARKRKDFQAAMFTHPLASVGAGLAETMTMSFPADKLELAERATEYMNIGLLSISTTPDGVWMRMIGVPLRSIRATGE